MSGMTSLDRVLSQQGHPSNTLTSSSTSILIFAIPAGHYSSNSVYIEAACTSADTPILRDSHYTGFSL